MRSIRTKHVIREVAIELALTQEQVMDIVTSPFELTAAVMKNKFDPEEDKYPMVRIPNFGIFMIPEVYQKFFKEKHGFISDEE